MSTLTYGSFFSGVDAPLYAVKDRVRALFACEIDHYCCETMRANYNIERIHEGDVMALDVGTLPYVDIFTAGFPCQPYSITGRQLGSADPRAGGWKVCCDYIDAHRPRLVLLENVPTFRNDEQGDTLRQLKQRITDAGYAHVSDHVCNALDYGSCQRRKRLFIVALRDAAAFVVPPPMGQREQFCDILEQQWMPHHTEITPARHAYLERRGRTRNVPDPHLVDTASVAPTLCASHWQNTWCHMIRMRDGRVRQVSARECFRIMGFGDDFRIVVARTRAIKQAGNSISVQTARALLEAMISAAGDTTASVRTELGRHAPSCVLCVVVESGAMPSLLADVPRPRIGTSSAEPAHDGLPILHAEWSELDAQEHLGGLAREQICFVFDERVCPGADPRKVRHLAGWCALVSDNGSTVQVHPLLLP